MFLGVSNKLINLGSITKIEARHKDGDPSNDSWEVAVFYRDERRFNPNLELGPDIAKDQEPTWVGTYESILIGSPERCRAVVAEIIEKIKGSDRVITLDNPIS